MSDTLDLSTGKENRISVNVSGWAHSKKDHFAREARLLGGVQNVMAAGGTTSFYIYYDPTAVSEKTLGERLTGLAGAIGAFGSQIDPEIPADALTIDGEAVTIDGEYVEFGNDMATASVVKNLVEQSASRWTGITSLEERIIAFKQLAPSALAAVDNLIAGIELASHNGGPHLDERQEAIDALRQLHKNLGQLLDAAERPGFGWADGDGLAASCAKYALRARNALRHDPIPFAASSLLLTFCAAIGFPGLGAFLSAGALSIRKPKG